MNMIKGTEEEGNSSYYGNPDYNYDADSPMKGNNAISNDNGHSYTASGSETNSSDVLDADRADQRSHETGAKRFGKRKGKHKNQRPPGANHNGKGIRPHSNAPSYSDSESDDIVMRRARTGTHVAAFLEYFDLYQLLCCFRPCLCKRAKKSEKESERTSSKKKSQNNAASPRTGLTGLGEDGEDEEDERSRLLGNDDHHGAAVGKAENDDPHLVLQTDEHGVNADEAAAVENLTVVVKMDDGGPRFTNSTGSNGADSNDHRDPTRHDGTTTRHGSRSAHGNSSQRSSSRRFSQLTGHYGSDELARYKRKFHTWFVSKKTCFMLLFLMVMALSFGVLGLCVWLQCMDWLNEVTWLGGGRKGDKGKDGGEGEGDDSDEAGDRFENGGEDDDSEGGNNNNEVEEKKPSKDDAERENQRRQAIEAAANSCSERVGVVVAQHEVVSGDRDVVGEERAFTEAKRQSADALIKQIEANDDGDRGNNNQSSSGSPSEGQSVISSQSGLSSARESTKAVALESAEVEQLREFANVERQLGNAKLDEAWDVFSMTIARQPADEAIEDGRVKLVEATANKKGAGEERELVGLKWKQAKRALIISRGDPIEIAKLNAERAAQAASTAETDAGKKRRDTEEEQKVVEMHKQMAQAKKDRSWAELEYRGPFLQRCGPIKAEDLKSVDAIYAKLGLRDPASKTFATLESISVKTIQGLSLDVEKLPYSLSRKAPPVKVWSVSAEIGHFVVPGKGYWRKNEFHELRPENLHTSCDPYHINKADRNTLNECADCCPIGKGTSKDDAKLRCINSPCYRPFSPEDVTIRCVDLTTVDGGRNKPKWNIFVDHSRMSKANLTRPSDDYQTFVKGLTDFEDRKENWAIKTNANNNGTGKSLEVWTAVKDVDIDGCEPGEYAKTPNFKLEK